MTNEQVVLNPAGFWVRFGAQLIDAIILSIPFGLSIYVFNETLTFYVIANIISFIYTLVLPILWNGQTVGKKLLGIRIKKISGEKIGLGTMLLRTFVAGLVYGITVGIASLASLFMVAFRKDKRSVHDLVAGTYVGYDR
jgi:uncharacterized RDD family membrane protein YckC